MPGLVIHRFHRLSKLHIYLSRDIYQVIYLCRKASQTMNLGYVSVNSVGSRSRRREGLESMISALDAFVFQDKTSRDCSVIFAVALGSMLQIQTLSVEIHYIFHYFCCINHDRDAVSIKSGPLLLSTRY